MIDSFFRILGISSQVTFIFFEGVESTNPNSITGAKLLFRGQKVSEADLMILVLTLEGSSGHQLLSWNRVEIPRNGGMDRTPVKSWEHG